MKKYIYILLIPSFLVSCSSTGVIPLGQNSYYIGKKDGAPGLGVSLSNKAKVYQEATNFCAQNGLELRILKETVIPARPAQLGSTELKFSCIKHGEIATPIAREADKIIEQRIR